MNEYCNQIARDGKHDSREKVESPAHCNLRYQKPDASPSFLFASPAKYNKSDGGQVQATRDDSPTELSWQDRSSITLTGHCQRLQGGAWDNQQTASWEVGTGE